MPIYEYRCRNGHTFEVFQSMSDDPVEACEECGAPVERVFHPVAVHFKGSGFYTTDYARKGGATKTATGDGGSSKDSTSSKSSDSGSPTDKKTSTKPD
jgi:putative FmdB family regulatory protein